MRPRNAREKLIAELSATLPAITAKQKQWAIDTCFEKIGYYTKGEVWCSHCGMVHVKTSSTLGISLVGDETTCPYCGTRLKLWRVGISPSSPLAKVSKCVVTSS